MFMIGICSGFVGMMSDGIDSSQAAFDDVPAYGNSENEV